MGNHKESPEQKRERLRQQELKKTSMGGVGDSFNKASQGSLVDLVGSLGWRGTGVLILLLIIGFLVYTVFFR